MTPADSLPLTLVVALLVAHWLGDWEWQSDWMALNKSTSWWALTAHVAVVTATYAAWTYPFAVTTVGWVVFVAVNGAAHFVTDAITSRLNARAFPWQPIRLIDIPDGCQVSVFAFANKGFMVPKEGGDRHRFFAGIGRDQLAHGVTLTYTAWWLLL